MRKPLRIESITIEGFRGINKKLSLPIGGRSVFLFGRNGVGKTSLLQAIEWCMFGKLAYLPAEEYKMEDATVNFFHPEKIASVELTLKDKDGKIIKLTRTRKMGKSTTRGKNPLNLEINKRVLTGDEAEEQVAKLLELTPEEYYARTHLHQETIRDLLFGEITDRSSMIDKMLGLYYLRQLVESLPVSTVDREIRNMKKEIKTTEEQKESYEKLLSQSKERLGKLANDLKNANVLPENVNLISFGETFSKAQAILLELGGLLDVDITQVKLPKSFEEMRDIPEMLSEQLTRIENQRTEIYGKLKEDLAKIDRLHDDYKKALDDQQRLDIDPAKIASEKQRILSQISELNQREQQVSNINVQLKAEETIANRLVNERSRYQTAMDEIVQKYGIETEMQGKIQELQEKILATTNLINQQGILSKLIDLGYQYFQAVSIDICPVCESKIAPDQVRASLSGRMKEQKEAKLIERLRSNIETLEREKQEHEKAIEDLADLVSKIEKNQMETEERKKLLKTLGVDVNQIETAEQLLSLIQTQIEYTETELQAIGEKIQAVERRKLEIEHMEEKFRSFEQIEKKIQEVVGFQLKGNELLAKLGEYRSSIQQRLDDIAKLGEKATAIRESSSLMRIMVDFLLKKSEVENTEKAMLPGVQAKLETLNEKLSKMEELGAALHDIHEAAISTQEQFLQATLGPLQSNINKFYSKLHCHPHFHNLRLEPETVRGKYLYRLRATSHDGTDSTYVQTGFSLAQMNLTAISLFLGMVIRDPTGFIVLDDPSQSLDPDHKKALASLIGEIGREQQIFVATQDEEFQKELRKITGELDGLVLNIGTWTPEGPRVEIISATLHS